MITKEPKTEELVCLCCRSEWGQSPDEGSRVQNRRTESVERQMSIKN